jgi:hypothetical protein
MMPTKIVVVFEKSLICLKCLPQRHPSDKCTGIQ